MSNEDTILVIEDEAAIHKFLRVGLSQEGYRVVEAFSGREGVAAAATHHPGIILLDLGLPDIDGIEVVRQIREWSEVPIIVLSARGQEDDKVSALDAGANDYLTKPFGMRELLARMRVALRAAESGQQGSSESIFEYEHLKIDHARREVFVDSVLVHLTPKEYRLLSLLTQHAGKVLTHRLLLGDVWGPAYAGQTQYLRVFMNQLRKKIEKDPSRPRMVITEPGVGYRFRIA